VDDLLKRRPASPAAVIDVRSRERVARIRRFVNRPSTFFQDTWSEIRRIESATITATDSLSRERI